MDKCEDLEPLDANNTEWSEFEYKRYRQWFNLNGTANMPLAPFETGDVLPHVPSAAEISDVEYISSRTIQTTHGTMIFIIFTYLYILLNNN
jgi:hypothetical protein